MILLLTWGCCFSKILASHDTFQTVATKKGILPLWYKTNVYNIVLSSVMASEANLELWGQTFIDGSLRPASVPSIEAYFDIVIYFINFGLTKLTLASGRRPCVRALYVGLVAVAVGVSDMWQVRDERWHATCDRWQVTHDTWQVTLYTWFFLFGGGFGF